MNVILTSKVLIDKRKQKYIATSFQLFFFKTTYYVGYVSERGNTLSRDYFTVQ